MKRILNQNRGLVVLLLAILLLLPIPAVIAVLQLNFIDFWGQVWRVFSAHFVHASWAHLWLNVINLLLVRFVFFDWLSNQRLLGFCCFAALFISFGLYVLYYFDFFLLTSYVGFSGVLHGLTVYLLLSHYLKMPVFCCIGLIFVTGKLIYEYLIGTGQWLAELISVVVLVEAHVLGAVAGLLFFIGCSFYVRKF